MFLTVCHAPGCLRHQGGGGHGRKWRSSHHLRRLQLGVVQSCVPAGAGRLPVGLLHPKSAGCAEAGAQRWRRELAVFSYVEVVTIQLLSSSNVSLLHHCTSKPDFHAYAGRGVVLICICYQPWCNFFLSVTVGTLCSRSGVAQINIHCYYYYYSSDWHWLWKVDFG